jgi:hypothetical protein
MGTGSFLGVKYGRGMLLTTHPLLVPWSWKSRAIPLPTLCNGVTVPGYFITLTERDRKQLNIFERKMYRRILGPVCDNEKEN